MSLSMMRRGIGPTRAAILSSSSVFQRDRKLLEYLHGLGIHPGAELQVLARNYDDTITLQIGGRSIPLGKAAAGKIWALAL